jgi:hypothetical protein
VLFENAGVLAQFGNRVFPDAALADGDLEFVLREGG